ncbi:MAG: oxygen-independent coproporphyrinogen III oxidase [Myxococcaceae bacterium]|nr:oxygen-independent coproporphyrinogen III oxidase [Myxococcaceae bacterium]
MGEERRGLRHDLLERYGTRAIPRYTSYPPANHWRPLTPEEPARALGRIERPLSIYVHVPFCKSLCWYCGCNMLIDHRGELVERYLSAIEREFELVSQLVPAEREVVQVHLGGGTPTHLSPAQLERLIGGLRRRFPWVKDVEASIEVHPPVTTQAQLETLAALGFNRLSMGVQDFDPEVQERINRRQPFEQTRDLVAAARRLGFQSVNMDLMYGLPLQTVERFGKTIELVREIDPDRIALFGYAHMPTLKKHHRLLKAEELPNAEGRLALLEFAIETLEARGWELIGLDHFARPHDELLKARRDGTLRRNFMGYTTCRDSEVLAFGPSSISEIDGTFLQSQHDVRAWCGELEAGRLAITRGWTPSEDDQLRRSLIMQLFCQLDVDTKAFGSEHGIDFEAYFRDEVARLAVLETDGLVRREPGHITLTAQGQLLLRNVAHVFDAYSKGPPKTHAPAV